MATNVIVCNVYKILMKTVSNNNGERLQMLLGYVDGRVTFPVLGHEESVR